MRTEKQEIDPQEALLEALDNPRIEFSKLNELLSTPEMQQDGHLLQDCRTVFIRQHFASQINPEQAWQEFKAKRSQKIYWITAICTLAASIAVFFFISKFTIITHSLQKKETVVLSPKNSFREISLTTDKGQSLALNHLPKYSLLLASKGINAEKEKLIYTGIAKTEPETHTLTTSRGCFYHLQLSDGTQVWLNAESSLTYPNFFTGSERVVELNGEGFFKVAADSLKPFRVKTNRIITEVLGTEFNIRMYDSKDSHITLLKGSIKVKHIDSAAEALVNPGEDAHLRENESWEIKEVDTDHYCLWTEGYFYFDNESLAEIMRKIGRWYNVKIIFKDPATMNLRLHFLAQRDQKIDHTLKLLNMMGNIKASFEDNTITIEPMIQLPCQK